MKTTKWFNLKSKIVFAFLIVLQLNSYAQNETWSLKLPDNGDATNIIEMPDSSYCVGLNAAKDTFIVYKISQHGELLWRTVIPENENATTGYNFWLSKVTLINDSIILFSGRYNDKALCLQISNEGEIIRKDYYEKSGGNLQFNSIGYFSEDKIWLSLRDSYNNNYKIVDYNYLTGHIDTVIDLDENFLMIKHILSEDSILTAGTEKLIMVNTNFDTLKYFDYETDGYGIGMNMAYDGDSCFYFISDQYGTQGILKLTKNLDFVAFFPDSVFYPTPSQGSNMFPRDLLINENNELVILGNMYYVWEYWITFVKASAITGEPVDIYTHFDIVAQYGRYMLRVPNGYIQTFYFQNGQNSSTYVVRVSENGDFNAISENLIKDDFISIFPNPSSTTVTISFKKNITAEIKIFNQASEVIKTLSIVNSDSIRIKTNNYPNGIYIITIRSKNNTYSKKLIINH